MLCLNRLSVYLLLCLSISDITKEMPRPDLSASIKAFNALPDVGQTMCKYHLTLLCTDHSSVFVFPSAAEDRQRTISALDDLLASLGDSMQH